MTKVINGNAALVILCVILNFAALYVHQNLGGGSLFLPFNSLVLIVVSLFILFFIYSVFVSGFMYVPEKYYLLFLSFFFFLLSGFLAGVDLRLDWLYRVSFLFLGLMFVFCICQFFVSSKESNVIFLLFSIFFILHALIGLSQIFFPNLPLYFLMLSNFDRPVGIFQQVNNQSVIMVFGALISMHAIGKDSFLHYAIKVKSVYILCLFLCVSVVFISGSRVGLLTFLISFFLLFPVLFLSLQYKKVLLYMLLPILFGVIFGFVFNDGFLNVYSKFANVANSGFESDIRWHIYRISIDLFLSSPFFGHGMGSFKSVFHEQAALYFSNNGGLPLIGYSNYTHPHNEILFWMVEGGLISLLAIFLFGLFFIFRMRSLTVKKNLVVISLISPFVIHSLVELPFYTSFYHFFVFLFFLTMLTQPEHSDSVVLVSFKSLLNSFLILFLGLFLIVVIVYSSFSFYYSYKIVDIFYSGRGTVHQLQKLQKHPFFSDIANRSYLNALSRQERENGVDVYYTELYVKWMLDYKERSPEIEIFSELILAYDYLDDVESLISIADLGLYFYPDNPIILDAIKNSSLVDEN